ncbi:MAG: L,D-transpeptidase [Gaiellaceae bacterium]
MRHTLCLVCGAAALLASASPASAAATARWGYVLKATVARAAPRASAHAVARIATATPLGNPNIVAAVAVQRDKAGRVWVRIRLPVLPNGSTGWIRKSTIDALHVVRTHLVVDLEQLQATLFRNDEEIFSAPIGAGQDRWPTPVGEFYVRERTRGFGNPFYGPIAFGLNARSRVLTDWPGGGFVGVHGTNQPDLLPGRVSHGCIRMRNDAILRLAKLMPLGTPVTIR